MAESEEAFGATLVSCDPQVYRFNFTSVSQYERSFSYVVTLPDAKLTPEQLSADRVEVEAAEDGFGELSERTPMIGLLEMVYSLRSNLHKGFVHVWIEPRWRHLGIGKEVLEFSKDELVKAGRTQLASWSKVVVADAQTPETDKLYPSDGSAAVDRRDGSTAAIVKAGFELQMLERPCRLTFFTAADLNEQRRKWQQLYEDAAAQAGEDYELVQWKDDDANRPTYAEIAQMWSGFTADIPSMEGHEPTVFTAEMVEERLRMPHRKQMTDYTTAVRHIPSGELVGYTELIVRRAATAAVQEDTWVSSAHRGHRLGMLMKAANMLWATDQTQMGGQMRVCISFNADSNTHMWAINEALGYERFAGEGAWRADI